jgi:hypothetical protein
MRGLLRLCRLLVRALILRLWFRLLGLRLLLRSLFALLFLGHVVADHTAYCRPGERMVMGEVAAHGANRGAFEAASLGKAGVRAERECQEQCNSFGFHVSPRS